MKIHLVRHGETDWNNDGRIQGWIDVGLNSRGREQAKNLADELSSNQSFDLVGSPLRRARETASLLETSLTVEEKWFIDEFKELDQGFWNGLTGDWLETRSDETYMSWQECPTETRPPSGESLTHVRSRVSNGLKFVLNNATSPVLIVAHKVVNSLVAHLLGEWEFEAVMESLDNNAEVRTLELHADDLLNV